MESVQPAVFNLRLICVWPCQLLYHSFFKHVKYLTILFKLKKKWRDKQRAITSKGHILRSINNKLFLNVGVYLSDVKQAQNTVFKSNRHQTTAYYNMNNIK